MKKFGISLLLCLAVLNISLFAQITASWLPADNLQFGPAPSPMDTNKFAAYIGTITFTVSGTQLFDPNILHTDFGNSFTFYGPMSWYNDAEGNPVYSDQSSKFHLVAVSDNKGTPEVKNIDQGDGSSPLRSESGNLNTNELKVDLYIIGYQDWIRYKPGALYTLTNGSLNSFKVGVAQNGSSYDSRGYQIPVDGFGMGDVQFMQQGNSLTNPVPYGPPDTEIEYMFSIIDQREFTISDAYHSSKAEIAKLDLRLSNAETNTPYTFQIIFRNQADNEHFYLHLNDTVIDKVIPYSIVFNDQYVTGNVAYDWTVLGDQGDITPVLVTSIDSQIAENAIAGYYSDTITVEIIPPDTI